MTQHWESIAMSGLLTVGTVTAGREALIAAFGRGDNIELEGHAQSPVDVVGVQLIQSARHYATQHGKQIRLSSPASGPLLEMLQLGGFLDGLSKDDRRFWLHDGGLQ
jgi:hypothetical protein